MREKQRKKKGRTWAEAAKTVLEKYPNTPMSHKEILQVIQRERLKEISGTSPLACLNAMLHTNSRGEEGIFYKVPGRMGVYTLKKDIADVVKELSEEGSEDSSDNLSDSRSTENSGSTNTKEARRGRWRRRVPAKLKSQPSSPQSRCSSPSVPSSKLISPSQKHSKKALKQALKQQQQRNQRRQCVMSPGSSPRLLLKTTVKGLSDSAADAKPGSTDYPQSISPAHSAITTTYPRLRSSSVASKAAWELKQVERPPASPQNSSSSSSSSSAKADCPPAGRKLSQRSSRLSARQLKRSRCEIDVETPDSILVNTNLRALINKHNFSALPYDCQLKLLQLLPEVDQQACMDGPMLKVTSSALNNEFFTSAAQSWKERLSEGEFTPELRLRMRQEFEKEKKVEVWKERFFESYYGENSGLSLEEAHELLAAASEPQPKAPVQQPAEPPCKPAVTAPVTRSTREQRQDLQRQASRTEGELAATTEKPPLSQTVVSSSVVRRSEGPVLRGAAKAALASQHTPTPPTPSLPPQKAEVSHPESSRDASASTPEATAALVSGPEEVAPAPAPGQPGGPPPPAPAPPPTPATVSPASPVATITTPPPPPPVTATADAPVTTAAVAAAAAAAAAITTATLSGTTTRRDAQKAPSSLSKGGPGDAAGAAALESGVVVSPAPSSSSSPHHEVPLLKRKASSIQQEAEASPERKKKKPCLAQPPGTTTTAITALSPSPSPSTTPTPTPTPTPPPPTTTTTCSPSLPSPASSPPAVTPTKEQRVPPLIIPVSRIMAAAGAATSPSPSPSPRAVSPRAPLVVAPPRSGRSGARTLADIKAKAQQARAKRAAAAAAAGTSPRGTVPGPGPGGGGSGPPTPTSLSSGSETPSPVKLSSPVSSPPPGAGRLLHAHPSSSSSTAMDLRTNQTLHHHHHHPHALFRPSLLPQQPQRPPAALTGPPVVGSPPSLLSGPLAFGTKSSSSSSASCSSSIPANNPLVTQLLQGKEIPLEKILPKPLARPEHPHTHPHTHLHPPVASSEEPTGRTRQQGASHGHPAPLKPGGHRGDQHQHQQPSPHQHHPHPHHHHHHHHPAPPPRDTLDRDTLTQEQILQAFMQRGGQPYAAAASSQQQDTRSLAAASSLQGPPLAPPPGSVQHQEPSFFPTGLLLGRKRSTRPPAVTGHYLLNVSTYGRSDAGKRTTAALQHPSSVAVPPLQVSLKRESPDTASGGGAGGEQRRLKEEEPDERRPVTEEQQGAKRVKTEEEEERCSWVKQEAGLDSQSGEMMQMDGSTGHRGGGGSGGGSEVGGDGQALGPCYGGTISMSVPAALNHHHAATVGSAPSSAQTPADTDPDAGNSGGGVMSFSVTVTTIPAGHHHHHHHHHHAGGGDAGGGGDESPEHAAFMEGAGSMAATMEEVQSKCYCRLKAMIMCKGCGAFCHDDCIGPSKLCVSCLVVR
ncbi:putative Polycomb group protein ASXL2 isoform X2 [Engraulis encrasicolus]|uniref:putative Polycomb group protein ASXL2 isoform X2 n=1 Tax=Engraulis encrasicolus TaxID=184585 RepID=UPI002FD50A35